MEYRLIIKYLKKDYEHIYLLTDAEPESEEFDAAVEAKTLDFEENNTDIVEILDITYEKVES